MSEDMTNFFYAGAIVAAATAAITFVVNMTGGIVVALWQENHKKDNAIKAFIIEIKVNIGILEQHIKYLNSQATKNLSWYFDEEFKNYNFSIPLKGIAEQLYIHGLLFKIFTEEDVIKFNEFLVFSQNADAKIRNDIGGVLTSYSQHNDVTKTKNELVSKFDKWARDFEDHKKFLQGILRLMEKK